MDDITERVAYLRGLAEGLDASEVGPAGPVLNGILDVLGELAHTLAAVETEQEDLADYVVDLDEGLTDLEDALEEEGGPDAPRGDGSPANVVWWTFTCPTCGARIDVSDDVFDDDEHVELVCPHCGTLVHDDDDDFEAAPDVDFEAAPDDDELSSRKTRDRV